MNKSNDLSLVSVIVPVYNVEKYVKNCILSILNQSYKNIEIIIINDGSLDNSLKIIEEVSKIDNRVKVISQKNKGLGGARNTGIFYANGEYILFVDSDDTIDKFMIEDLYKISISNDYDIVTCRFNRLYRNGKIDLISHNDTYTEDLIEDILLGHIAPMVWNKFFKKELFNNIRFDEREYYEDHFPILQLFSKAKRVHSSNNIYYNWFINDGSITRTLTEKHILDFLNVMNKCLDFLKTKKNYKKYEQLFINRVFYLITSHILINFKIIKKENVLNLLEILNKGIIELFDNTCFFKILKNKYRVTFINFFSKIIEILNFHRIKFNCIEHFFFFDKLLLKKLNYLLDDIHSIETLLYRQIKEKKCNKLFIYAGGKICEQLVELIMNSDYEIKIENIIDSNLKNKYIKGIKIIKIEDIPIKKLDDSYVVVATEAYENEIITILDSFVAKNNINLKIISPYGFV